MNTQHPAERTAFDADGFVVLRRFFCAEEIEALRVPVERIFNEWLQQHRDECMQFGLINMHSLTRPEYFRGKDADRPAFFEAVANGKLTARISAMFGPEIGFHNTQLFFNPLDPGKSPYWHRDGQYTDIDDAVLAEEQARMLSLHVRIPLLAEQGLELIPGTHARWDTALERDVRLELNGHAQSEELPGAVLMDLEPGDVLIFSAQMLHRGIYRLSAKRLAFDICIGKPHPLLTPQLDEEVLPTDPELERIRHDQWYRLARRVARQSRQG